tara:strand:- start:62 stop:487 length:426 start_codon:yes stop_codon:yes gene_type:complete
MKNPRSLFADIQFGAEKEENIINSLQKYFQSSDIHAMNDKYCIYDAEDSTTKTRYEIKARRIKFTTYPTTIIPVHKKNASKNCDRLLFVFGFSDGLYYVKYDQVLFNTFDTKSISYNRLGCATKPVLHYCIPNEYLLPIIL